jgi:hypothetical protein
MASLFCAAPGLSRDQLEPWNVLSRIEILLGQADTLERLQRSKDRERKLAWGMAVTLDCLEAYPDSPLAPLSAALVGRAAGRLELASQLLSRAGKLDHDRTCGNRIGYEENLTSSRLFRIQPKKSSLRVWRLLQHGVIPGSSHTQALGISSPGLDGAHLMGPGNDGEQPWNAMSDWTCR